MTKRSRCKGCGQPLRRPKWQELGYGEKCARDRGLLPPKKPRRTRAARRPKPTAVSPAPDAIPGQTALELVFHQPTLESL